MDAKRKAKISIIKDDPAKPPVHAVYIYFRDGVFTDDQAAVEAEAFGRLSYARDISTTSGFVRVRPTERIGEPVAQLLQFIKERFEIVDWVES